MKLVFLILLSISFSSANSFSQINEDWVRRYNGTGNASDISKAIAIDALGNIYVTGHCTSLGSNIDYLTIKYDPSGNLIWSQSYNGSGNGWDIANSIVVDNSGNVYVTGYSDGSTTSWDYVTIKYNSNGVEQWVRRYNGPVSNSIDEASSMVIDGFGNIYVTGSSYGGSLEKRDYATIKYNSVGDQIWVRRYNFGGNGGVSGDIANSIAIDGSGNNIYVAGYSDGDAITKIDYATIKYNSLGVQQWAKRYNQSNNSNDLAYSVAVDNSGNVYVTGSSDAGGITTDFATLKYNSIGDQIWLRRYNGFDNANDGGSCIKTDNFGNVYVGGESSNDFATIKYNSLGDTLWVRIYSSTINNVWSYVRDLDLDNFGNVYLTGISGVTGINNDFVTLKYNSSGVQQWIQMYNGPGNGDDVTSSIKVDFSGNVYITGGSSGLGTNKDFATIKYSQQQLALKQPLPYTKWISGENNTIQWIGWNNVNIKCQRNSGTPLQSDTILASNLNVSQTEYVWNIADNFLSFRSKIIIENAANPSQFIESGIFRIKPYLLTRVNPDSTYYEYKKDRDQWGFWNEESQMFSSTWYQQFDYQGVDPFTGITYPQWQGFFTFKNARKENFPDWISWVNTFTINSCYWNTTLGVYKQWAIIDWALNKKRSWDGSCFGLAIPNAIVFRNKASFLSKYTSFPAFTQPISVDTNAQVRRVVNELFVHQIGEPHSSYRLNVGFKKNSTQTLTEIKNMLINDEPLRTLSFFKNNPHNGGHTVVPYKVKQNDSIPNIYYVYIYDNAKPTTLTPIIIDTSANNNSGSWKSSDWEDWGGHFFLDEPSESYLINPSFFNFNLEIFSTQNSEIQIKDALGNITGFINDSVITNIPSSYPITLNDGTISVPKGYSLPNDNYSVKIENSIADTLTSAFKSMDDIYLYERYNANSSQTDNLYYDGNLLISNPDTEVKTIKLYKLRKETSNEKAFSFSSLNINQNDTVKFEKQGNDILKLIAKGSSKTYDIELNYSSEIGMDRFLNVNIPIPSNSSHTFVPNWNNITTSQLVILQDIGNNGTIDDTLRIKNIITNLEEGLISLPDNYYLSQNYPNPFNPTTLIRYDIKYDEIVSLKVYDILGKEVASLVNELKQAGRYEIEFDGANLSSGIYYYQLQSGNFIETKKMLLLK